MPRTCHIAARDAVRVFNDRGEWLLRDAIAITVPTGVGCMNATRWPKLTTGNNANMLTWRRLTDRGGPAFYSCLVQVEIQ